MITVSRCFASLALIAASLPGCGSNDDPVGDEGPPYPDVGTFCQALAQAECTPSMLTACQVEQTDCVTRRRSVCLQAVPYDLTYRPGAAQACLDASAVAYADAQLDAKDMENIEAVCDLVFGGSDGVGLSCDEDRTCNLDASLRCVTKPGAEHGTCQQPETVEAAFDCSADNAVCEDGTFCTGGDLPTCAAKRDSGKACSDTVLCMDDLRCTGGTCQAKLPLQAVCTTDDDCTSGICYAGESAKKCLAYIPFTAIGGTCDEFQP